MVQIASDDHSAFTEPIDPPTARHYATVYGSRAELFEAVGPFLSDGLRANQRCYYLHGVNGRRSAVEGLEAAGLDASTALEQGALVVRDAREVFLDDGFDPEAAVGAVTDLLRDAPDGGGFEGARIAGNTDWIPEEGVDVEAFMAYEREVTRQVFEPGDERALCGYPRSAFDPDVLAEVLRTHSAIAAGSTTTRTEYYGGSEGGGAVPRLRALEERADLEGTIKEFTRICRRFSGAVRSGDTDVDALCERAIDVWERALSPTAVGLWRVDRRGDDVTLSAARTTADLDREASAVLGPLEDTARRALFLDETVVADDLESDVVDTGVFQPIEDWYVLAAVDAGTGGFDDVAQSLASAAGHALETAVGEAEARSEFRRTEAELDRAEVEVRRLERARSLSRRTSRAIEDGTTRADLRSGVCDAVAASNAIDLAWYGRTDPDGGTTVEAVRGDGRGYPDDVPLTDEDAEEPAVSTARTGEPTFEDDVPGGDDGAWREAALDRGFTAAIAVPVADDGHQYGVLAAYSHRSSAFDDRTRAALTEIGRRLARALAALGRTDALAGDRTVEVVLDVRDGRAPMVRLAREADCRLELQGVARTDAEGSVGYVRCVDGTAADVATAADGTVGVGDAAPIDAPEEVARVELGEPSVGSVVAEYGGSLAAMSVSPDVARATVELPRTVDVGTVVDAVSSAFPDTELAATHDRGRPHTDGDRLGRGRAALTDRQEEVLRAAHSEGYFERPRRSDGEAIAESLGISSPTFHQHRRVAIGRLLRAMFEG